MSDREIAIPPSLARPAPALTLCTSPNWTAIIFFLGLAGLHLSIAIPAFLHRRWEGYMSAILACAFTTAAIIVFRAKTIITFDSQCRVIRLRHGTRRMNFNRVIGFDDIHAVRLTMSRNDRPRTRIEVLCDNEDIECPATSEPRQEALLLAMMLDVRLIKVWADANADSESSPRL